ncbi:MAG TPA: TonB-dependent receptor [Fluviicoccus sp.]|nr:TonB-dependent receptor [Fluviicoccus sp.]
MSRPLVLAILAVVTAPAAFSADVFLPDTDTDIPTVFSATRLRQSIADAPASITVIDRQMIGQSGARELPELLRLVPGMVVGYDTGWNAFVSYHGTSADMARRMQVLVDGRSVYQPSLAYVDWIGFPVELEDIDRIEVIRGPNAAAYGANSFLGVVNIVTRHPADLARVRAYARTGGDGIRDSFAGVAGSAGQVSGQLSVSQRNDHGYSHLLDRNGNSTGDYLDSKWQKAVNGKLALDLGADASLTLRGGHSELTGQNKMLDTGFLEFLDTHDTDIRQDYAGFSLESAFSNHQVQVSGNYTRFKSYEPLRVSTYPGLMSPTLRQLFLQSRKYVNRGLLPAIDGVLQGEIPQETLFPELFYALDPSSYPPPAGVFEAWAAGKNPKSIAEYLMVREYYTTDASLQNFTNAFLLELTNPVMTSRQVFLAAIDNAESRTEVEIQDTWTAGKNLRVVYGAGYQDSSSDSEYYFNGKRVENAVWRIFAHAEWQFRPNWRLNLGVMDEHDENAGHLTSPRLAVNWRFAPTQSLRAVSSVAYRTPDLQESKSDWEFKVRAEDRSLSALDGAYFYIGQSPNGTMMCIDSPSHYRVVCSDRAPNEKIVSRELGYYGEFPAEHLQVDVRWFNDELDLTEHNLEIENFVITPNYRHQQRGVEVSGQWRPLPEWRVLANYAYDDITGTNDNAMFVPKHSGNVALWYEHPEGYQASLGYVFYDHLFENVTENYSRDLHLLNMRLARKWSVANRHDLELAGVWQVRLTNEHELRKENGAPRDRLWLQLSYAFE